MPQPDETPAPQAVPPGPAGARPRASDRWDPVTTPEPETALVTADAHGPAVGSGPTAPADPAAPPPSRRAHAAAGGGDDAALSTHDRLLVALLGTRTLLLGATRRARVTGWLWPLAVTLLGGVLRFWRLGTPHELVFDETYYVKQAYSLLVQGYEGTWGDDANPLFAAGDGSALQDQAEYIVHPMVAKWLMALGIHLGGGIGSSAAWRLASAVAGTLAVLMVARIGRRLFASTALGTLAGLFLAVDGEGIVHSRTGLLDGFLMVFALAAFGALLLDRDQARRRLAARTAAVLDSGAPLGLGPRLGWRWWRFAAAVLLGLAIGTKWSGLYVLAVFGLLSVAWDATARRTVGVRRWPLAALWRDAVPAALVMVPTAALVYVATWWSWFAHPAAYLRQWAVEHPGEGVTWLPPALRSLWHFHTQMWDFHTHLTAEHAYAAHPLGWIVQWRPTSFYYPDSVSGLTGAAARDACGADACSQAITSLGNPVLWWLGAVALVVAVVVLVVRRDWRAGAVLSGVVAGWLPWFAYAHRTIFTFYSIAFAPWVVLALVYVLGLLLHSGDDRRRRRGIATTVAVTLVVLAVSAFFYPVWTAWVVPYDFWHLHMWLRSWI
nr:phospholipid carrier-dependent glycosyltransferase [Cellulomonas sp. C5510]